MSPSYFSLPSPCYCFLSQAVARGKTSGNVTPATGPTTEEAFLEQFRVAYSSKDLDRIMACWCWDGNTEEDLAPVRDQVAADLELTVKEIRIEPLHGDEITQFTLKGVTYVTNLNPIARVVIEFDTGNPNATNSTSLLYGKDPDGVLKITTTRPK